MRKEAIYARQSIDKKDSVSIETQQAECEKATKGAFEVYSDRGFSGKNTERPQLQALLREIEHGRISKVIVYRLDRISRNITDFYNLYEVMKRYNCEFVSVSEAFDTSSIMGRAMMGIIAVFAQMERETIQQRIKDNYYFRITDGRWAGGPAPYGYKNARTIENKPTLEETPNLEAVKLAFKLYADESNVSLTKVASELQRKGFKCGKGFCAANVSRILKNPIYAVADQTLYTYYKGMRLNFTNEATNWNGETSAAIVGKEQTKGNQRQKTDPTEQSIYLTNIKGFIDSKTFINVQKRLAQNEQFKRANDSNTRLQELAGLIKCAKCGYAVKMKTHYPTLSCDGRSRLHLCEASFRGVRLENIQEQVADFVQEYFDTMAIRQHAEEAKKKELQDKADKLKDEISRLVSMAAMSEALAIATAKTIEERQNELNEIELKLALDATNAIDEMKQILHKEYIPKHIEYRKLYYEDKQAVCKILIEKILLYEDGHVEIVSRQR